jgi:hypothetical protein
MHGEASDGKGYSGGGHVTEHVTHDETTTEDDLVVSAGALTYEGRVYVPDSPGLRSKVTTLHHDTRNLRTAIRSRL